MQNQLDQIDIMEQMQLELWERQQMMMMMPHNHQVQLQHQHQPPCSVPTEIEIMPTSDTDSDQQYNTTSTATTTNTTCTNHRPSYPTSWTASPPSVECHDGRVTFRPHGLSSQSQNHYNNQQQLGMSFTTEALTNEENAEDYYFYRDGDDDIHHDNDNEGKIMMMHCEQYYEDENECYAQPRSSYPLLMDGCADKEELREVEKAESSSYDPDDRHDAPRRSMTTTPTMMIVTRPSSPPPEQHQDPPAEVENRLVVISQRGRRHYHNTPALEPEEYAYPREFTSLTIMKPSAPADPHPQSNYSRSSGTSSHRGSTSSNYPQEQLTTLPLSSINDHRIGAIIATTTTTTSSSSAHEQYNGYQHCFVTVLTEHRFLMLYTFLSRHSDHHNTKIVVLFSTTESLMYYTALLHRLKFNVRAVHAGMKQKEVDATLHEFSMSVGCSDEVEEDGDDDDSNTRILCMLDFQGHDTSMTIPSTTNWIVQFEPCTKPSEYIYQVGRISHESSIGGGRRPSNNGRQTPPRALLFLTPNEYGFHRYYKAAQVKTYEYEIPHLCNVQNRLIKLLRSDDNSQLRKLGLRACRSYLFAYARHEFGDIYNVKELDIEKVALSFGFDKLPSEELLEGIRNGGKDAEVDADALDIVIDEKVRSTSRSNKISSSGNSWRRKPVKTNNNANWMTGEKTWRHADRHAEKMKVNSNKSSSSASIKPKFVVTR